MNEDIVKGLIWLIALIVIPIIIYIKMFVIKKNHKNNVELDEREMLKKKIVFATIFSCLFVIITPFLYADYARKDMTFGKYDDICRLATSVDDYVFTDTIAYHIKDETKTYSKEDIKKIMIRIKAHADNYSNQVNIIPIVIMDNSKKDDSDVIVVRPCNGDTNQTDYTDAIDNIFDSLDESHQYKIISSSLDNGENVGRLEVITIVY